MFRVPVLLTQRCAKNDWIWQCWLEWASYRTGLRLIRRRLGHELAYCKSRSRDLPKTTDLFALLGISYKQNKFNLLREQSEGYSKLTAELTSSLGPSHSPTTGRPVESYALIEDRARSVWERVISLIGYFDLDPNRALDIILDVLSVHLATHYSFFIALLSFSPWSPPDRVSVTKKEMPAATDTPSPYKGLNLSEVLSLAENMSASGTNDASQSTRRTPRVLAQVLGFKFAYYQASLSDINHFC